MNLSSSDLLGVHVKFGYTPSHDVAGVYCPPWLHDVSLDCVKPPGFNQTKILKRYDHSQC